MPILLYMDLRVVPWAVSLASSTAHTTRAASRGRETFVGHQPGVGGHRPTATLARHVGGSGSETRTCRNFHARGGDYHAVVRGQWLTWVLAMGNVQACCSSVGSDAPTPQPLLRAPGAETEEIEDFEDDEESESRLASLMPRGVANVTGERGHSTTPAENAVNNDQKSLNEDEAVGLETVSLLEAQPEPEPEKQSSPFAGAKQMYLNAQKAKAAKAKAAKANAPDPKAAIREDKVHRTDATGRSE